MSYDIENDFDDDEILAQLLIQRDLERVSPRLEAFRNPSIGGYCSPEIRIKGARGGRGAGAKSRGMTSLIVQRANIESIPIACFREIQESLEESVYKLIRDTVEFLGYKDWKFTREYIESPTDSRFIFRGLKDLRASNNIKGLEGFKIFFLEEAATISKESLDLIMPTLMRTPGSELMFCYNPETELDPITEKIWNRNRSDALCIELMPGPIDNPWWNEGLQKEMEEDFKADPDNAIHIWNGLPRKQGQKSALARDKVRFAMDRIIENPEGGPAYGADIARFGDDTTQFYKRIGMKTVDQKTLNYSPIPETARELWDFMGRDPSSPVRIDDTGLGGGVTDLMREFGAMVIPVNNASSAMDDKKYPNTGSEQWFKFDEILDQCQIPDDPDLMRQLSSRQYYYDTNNRRCIEPKKEYKKRMGKSPDKADALLLCFYPDFELKMDERIMESLRRRRLGG